MGQTKTKFIDDFAPAEEKKKKQHKLIKGKARGEPESVIASEAKQSTESEEKIEEIATATPDGGPRNDKVKKPGKAKPRSKKYQEISKDLDRTKNYPIDEAVDMVKKLSYSKFNATLEAHILTSASGLRGLVSLPYAKGKKLRILAFPSTSLRVNSKGAPEQEYEGVVFGDDSTIEKINKGKVDFDLALTTPEWMPKLAKVAKILGPRGLMPNPKNGTIVSGEDGLKKAVESFQAGKTEYETEPKAPVIHLALGKLDQPTEELSANIKTLLLTLGKSRVRKVSLSPTMGPSVKVDLTSL